MPRPGGIHSCALLDEVSAGLCARGASAYRTVRQQVCGDARLHSCEGVVPEHDAGGHGTYTVRCLSGSGISLRPAAAIVPTPGVTVAACSCQVTQLKPAIPGPKA